MFRNRDGTRMAIRAPSPDQMNRHAIEVLEAARLAADKALGKPSANVHLALSWLTFNQVAESWQAEKYSEALTTIPAHGTADYVRYRDMQIYVDR